MSSVHPREPRRTVCRQNRPPAGRRFPSCPARVPLRAAGRSLSCGWNSQLGSLYALLWTLCVAIDVVDLGERQGQRRSGAGLRGPQQPVVQHGAHVVADPRLVGQAAHVHGVHGRQQRQAQLCLGVVHGRPQVAAGGLVGPIGQPDERPVDPRPIEPFVRDEQGSSVRIRRIRRLRCEHPRTETALQPVGEFEEDVDLEGVTDIAAHRFQPRQFLLKQRLDGGARRHLFRRRAARAERAGGLQREVVERHAGHQKLGHLHGHDIARHGDGDLREVAARTVGDESREPEAGDLAAGRQHDRERGWRGELQFRRLGRDAGHERTERQIGEGGEGAIEIGVVTGSATAGTLKCSAGRRRRLRAAACRRHHGGDLAARVHHGEWRLIAHDDVPRGHGQQVADRVEPCADARSRRGHRGSVGQQDQEVDVRERASSWVVHGDAGDERLTGRMGEWLTVIPSVSAAPCAWTFKAPAVDGAGTEEGRSRGGVS